MPVFRRSHNPRPITPPSASLQHIGGASRHQLVYNAAELGDLRLERLVLHLKGIVLRFLRRNFRQIRDTARETLLPLQEHPALMMQLMLEAF